MTRILFKKTAQTRKRPGKINEASHDKMMAGMAGICEIIGLSRSDFFNIDITSDVYPKLFMSISLENLERCSLPLTPDDIIGAFQNSARHVVGFSAATNLEDVYRNKAITFQQDKYLGQFLNETSDNIVEPKGKTLFVLGDINYGAAYSMKFLKRNLVIELATICAVKAEILEFIQGAPPSQCPKVDMYNSIAKGLAPHWIKHNLSLPTLTEEKLNNPKWLKREIETLRTACVKLKRHIDKKDQPTAVRIIGYGPIITKKWAKHLTPKNS
ncbi:MAG: hypothetical protein PHD48_10115 [Alphaproteobacteria bacterium]|nr:hypothetical protein [Alphaproteobacteria bacterium]